MDEEPPVLRQDSSNDLNVIFVQFVRMPLDLAVASLQLPLKAFQQLQVWIAAPDAQMRVVNASQSGLQATMTTTPDSSRPLPADSGRQPSDYSCKEKECKMTDYDYGDFGGDDLKYVSYSIYFTRRDFEANLQQEQEEVVDYPTSAAAFAGLKIAQFFGTLIGNGLPVPSIWGGKLPNSDYEKFVKNGQLRGIPEDDHKYVDIQLKVSRRLAKQDGEYDRQKVEILKDISVGIKAASENILKKKP